MSFRVNKKSQMKTTMAIRLPLDIDRRLKSLAERTGRTKTWHAREAILCHLEDLEDTYIAMEQIKSPGKRLAIQRRKPFGADD